MISIKYPSVKDYNTDYHTLLRKDKNSDYFVRSVAKKYENIIPPINTIEIETINRCNNDCSFCPVNRNDDTRPFCKMSEELFKKIIDELAQNNYSGYISLFSNNEPLVDVRIFQFLKYAKDKLPNATHCMYTNGILLDDEKYEELVKYLDFLVIDNYDDDLKLLPNVSEIYNKYKDDTEHSCKVSILMRKKNQVLLNRGGVAPNRKQSDNFSSSCVYPFMQMIIRPDGKISRCCQDALAKTTLGDVSENSVFDVWKNKDFCEFRTGLIKEGRSCADFCKNCDTFGISNYFPEIWTHIVVNAFVELILERKQEGKKIYLYDDNKITRKINQILKLHGVSIDGNIFKSDKSKLYDEESFIVFSSNDYSELDEIDYALEKIGKKYIAYEAPEHSLHTEFIDENANQDTKEFIRFIDTVRNKKTVIFGTGFSAEKVSSVFNIDVEYYIDNNKNKEGTEFAGKKIWLPVKLKEENNDDICVVIASLKYYEMKKQLLDNGLCKEENIFEGLRYIE